MTTARRCAILLHPGEDKALQRNEVDPLADEALPELAPVRPGENLDWARVEQYLRGNLPGDVFDAAGHFEVLQFPNGSANLTYLIRFGESELVLRRPPFGELAPGAHDMKREFRVLSRLWRIFDAAPRAYLFCDDHTIGGADFFVMERRRGEVIRGVVPPTMRHHREIGLRIGMALVDRIAEFHTLDPEAVDLGRLGRPDGFVARQLKGWKQRWDLVADGRYDAEMSAVHARLENSRPESQRVSLVHNDLKLDNCLFDPGDPDRVTAFFDWDMTTLGDPLIDIGTLLNYWPDPADTEDSKRFSYDGMQHVGLPSRAAITARYAKKSGLDLANIGWYEAFALWKSGTVVQQLHHRWKVGDSTDPRMETVADGLPRLIHNATRLLDSGRGAP